MYILLVSIVLGLVAGMLFISFYFRWKVLKIYHYLIANKVEFSAEHILNKAKLKEEIIPLYPDSEKEILTFVNYVRYSLRIASILIVLITAFGLILMYYSRYEH